MLLTQQFGDFATRKVMFNDSCKNGCNLYLSRHPRSHPGAVTTLISLAQAGGSQAWDQSCGCGTRAAAVRACEPLEGEGCRAGASSRALSRFGPWSAPRPSSAWSRLPLHQVGCGHEPAAVPGEWRLLRVWRRLCVPAPGAAVPPAVSIQGLLSESCNWPSVINWQRVWLPCAESSSGAGERSEPRGFCSEICLKRPFAACAWCPGEASDLCLFTW